MRDGNTSNRLFIALSSLTGQSVERVCEIKRRRLVCRTWPSWEVYRIPSINNLQYTSVGGAEWCWGEWNVREEVGHALTGCSCADYSRRSQCSGRMRVANSGNLVSSLYALSSRSKRWNSAWYKTKWPVFQAMYAWTRPTVCHFTSVESGTVEKLLR